MKKYKCNECFYTWTNVEDNTMSYSKCPMCEDKNIEIYTKKNKLSNYEKFLGSLINNNSIIELQQYLSRQKRIDRRVATREQKEIILDTDIFDIIDTEKDDINWETKDWYNAPILRVAYVCCLNNQKMSIQIANKHITNSNKKIKLQKNKEKLLNINENATKIIFEIVKEITDRINKDSDNIAITQRFKEYYKRTVNTELI